MKDQKLSPVVKPGPTNKDKKSAQNQGPTKGEYRDIRKPKQ